MGKDLKQRLGGLAMIAIGVVFAWLAIWRPLQAARAHEPRVDLWMKGVVIVPLGIIFGLALLIGGDRYEYRTADHKNLTRAGWVLFALVAVVAFPLYFWLDGRLTALGYGQ